MAGRKQIGLTIKKWLCLLLVLVGVYGLAVKNASFGSIQLRRAGDTAAAVSLLHTEAATFPEAAIQLDVPYISQLPELRNGCEITASAMLLNYFGINVDKCTLADDYLPKLYPYNAADPEEGYMGDPYTVWGYYCMTKPIVTAINDYLTDQAARCGRLWTSPARRWRISRTALHAVCPCRHGSRSILPRPPTTARFCCPTANGPTRTCTAWSSPACPNPNLP